MVIVYLYIRRLTYWLIQIIFKNINSVFPSGFIFLLFFFRVCVVFSMQYKMCYFGFAAFWIVLNVLVQQVNVTEVEVFLEIKQ